MTNFFSNGSLGRGLARDGGQGRERDPAGQGHPGRHGDEDGEGVAAVQPVQALQLGVRQGEDAGAAGEGEGGEAEQERGDPRAGVR